MKVCTFFGHRDTPEDIRPFLHDTLTELIVGAGEGFANRINGNYNIACSKTGDGFWENAGSVRPFNQRINSWQIGAAYYF